MKITKNKKIPKVIIVIVPKKLYNYIKIIILQKAVSLKNKEFWKIQWAQKNQKQKKLRVKIYLIYKYNNNCICKIISNNNNHNSHVLVTIHFLIL